MSLKGGHFKSLPVFKPHSFFEAYEVSVFDIANFQPSAIAR